MPWYRKSEFALYDLSHRLPARMIVGDLKTHYHHLSFSGGGLRCFWQGGAIHALGEAQQIQPVRIAAASGGALSAASFIARRGDELLDIFSRHIEEQDRNVQWNALCGDDDLTPHQRMYSSVVHELLDETACQRIVNGPVFEILLARPPESLPKGLAAGLTLIAYEADKAVRSTPHGRFSEAIGTREIRVDARKAAEDGNLAALICLAATIPPVFAIKDWKGEPVIDAGTVDNAPIPLAPDEDEEDIDALVLLTRSYRNLPGIDRRTYIYPSEATPVDKIDFTDAEGLRATYEQGRADMEELLERRDAAS